MMIDVKGDSSSSSSSSLAWHFRTTDDPLREREANLGSPMML